MPGMIRKNILRGAFAISVVALTGSVAVEGLKLTSKSAAPVAEPVDEQAQLIQAIMEADRVSEEEARAMLGLAKRAEFARSGVPDAARAAEAARAVDEEADEALLAEVLEESRRTASPEAVAHMERMDEMDSAESRIEEKIRDAGQHRQIDRDEVVRRYGHLIEKDRLEAKRDIFASERAELDAKIAAIPEGPAGRTSYSVADALGDTAQMRLAIARSEEEYLEKLNEEVAFQESAQESEAQLKFKIERALSEEDKILLQFKKGQYSVSWQAEKKRTLPLLMENFKLQLTLADEVWELSNSLYRDVWVIFDGLPNLFKVKGIVGEPIDVSQLAEAKFGFQRFEAIFKEMCAYGLINTRGAVADEMPAVIRSIYDEIARGRPGNFMNTMDLIEFYANVRTPEFTKEDDGVEDDEIMSLEELRDIYGVELPAAAQLGAAHLHPAFSAPPPAPFPAGLRSVGPSAVEAAR